MGFGGKRCPYAGIAAFWCPLPANFQTRETLPDLSSAFLLRAFRFCKFNLLQTEVVLRRVMRSFGQR
jgi:hypothetical protein